jgi:hypothetical protein
MTEAYNLVTEKESYNEPQKQVPIEHVIVRVSNTDMAQCRAECVGKEFGKTGRT